MILLGAASLQARADIQYVYDPGGRLVQVVAADGSSAVYQYDAAGNILSITRLAAGQLAFVTTSSTSGTTGTQITIYGSGFSTTPSNDIVTVNGVEATVVSATADQLVVDIPTGATSGEISVSVSGQNVSSSQPLGVYSGPAISSFGPAIINQGATETIQGNNFTSSAGATAVYVGSSEAVSASVSPSLITFPAESSGAITVATPYGSATSSSELISVPTSIGAANVVSSAVLIPNGQAQTVSVGAQNQYGILSFDASRGQLLTIQLTSVVTSPGGAAIAYQVFSPNDTQIASGSVTATSKSIQLPQISTAGTYFIAFVSGSSSSIQVSANLVIDPAVAAQIDGPSVSVATTIPAEQARISFTTTSANQQVSLQISSSTYQYCSYGNVNLTATSPSTTEITSYHLCAGANLMTIATAGTYVLTVVPYGSDTGSITARLQDAPTASASAVIDGSTVTVTTTVPAQQAQITFTTTSAGQQVSLQISGSTYQYCSYGNLILTGPAPATTQISSYHLCTGATLMTIATAGTYTLTVVPYGSDTGSITVLLQNAPTVTGSATIDGSAVTVTTTVPAQQAQITFTTTSANQQVSLQVSNSTYPSSCYSGALQFTGPSPAITSVGGSNFCSNAYLLTLATAGTYTVTVVPRGTDTGSIVLQVRNAPTVTGSATIDGSAVTVTTTVPAQQAQITFTTTSANQLVSLQVSNSTYPSSCYSGALQFTGPSPAITSVGGSNFCSNAYLLTLATAGTYTVTVVPRGTDTGSIVLQVRNAPTVTASATIGGSAVTVTTTVPAQQAQITFTAASANQQVSLQVSNSTYPSTCYAGALHVTGPSPSTSSVAGYNFCGSTYQLTLAAAGTYTITVVPTGSDIGSITISLQ